MNRRIFFKTLVTVSVIHTLLVPRASVLARTAGSVRIGHLADLHFGPGDASINTDYLRMAVERINEQGVDEGWQYNQSSSDQQYTV
jgi:hypothetical protein